MNVITKTLSGAEISVAIGGQNTEIRNDGAAMIYASANAGVVAGADGVVAIPAGAAVTVLDTRGTVYLLGTGEVSVVGKDTVSAVFKCAPTTGGSGQDDVARQAITAHAGNTEIHVSAAEKASWNDKADLSDIPTSLPADGGNADTLDGKHANDFIYARGYFDNIDLDDIKYPCSALALNCVHSPSSQWGTLLVYAGGTGSFTQIFIPTENGGTPTAMYFRHYGDIGWTAWRNTADGGDAATLDTHPASDFVLKSDYDALAARVAALENGGTT